MRMVIGMNHAAAMMPKPPEPTMTIASVTQLRMAAAVYMPLVDDPANADAGMPGAGMAG